MFKKLRQKYILLFTLSLFFIAFMLYDSLNEPFEKIPFYDLYQQEHPITLIPEKEETPSIDLQRIQSNEIIAQNEKYILKKDSTGGWLILSKKSGKILKKLPASVDMALLSHLIGKKAFTTYRKTPIFETNSTLVNTKKYRVIHDRYGTIVIYDKKDKAVKKFTPQPIQPIKAAAVSNHILWLYQTDLYAVDLTSMQEIQALHTPGIQAKYAHLYPFKTGVLLYIVRYENDGIGRYLLYYPFTRSGKALQTPELWRIKDVVYAIRQKAHRLLMQIGKRTYAIIPTKDNVKWEIL